MLVPESLTVQVLLLGVSIAGLSFGARAFVDAAAGLARRLGLTELVIGLTVVAMGTSAPELVVRTDAALAGLGDLAVGNVVGSNIYNVAVILGVVSVITIVPVERSLVRRDGIMLLVATAVGVVMLLDQRIGRSDGAIAAGLFTAYTIYLVYDERGTPSIDTTFVESPVIPRWRGRGRDEVTLLVGLLLVLGSGHLLVTSASAIAATAGIAEGVMGGTIVAAGTSTPELAVSLVAMRRGHVGMTVGNVVGSNIFNVLGSLGVAALLDPLSTSGTIRRSLLWLSAITLLIVVALWSGRRLTRKEGFGFMLSEITRWALGLVRTIG